MPLPTSGLIGEWKFDELASGQSPDSSPFARPALTYGLGLVPGRFGQAVRIEGGAVNLPVGAVVTGDSPRTVSLWVLAPAGGLRTVYASGSNSTGAAFFVFVDTDKIVFSTYGAGEYTDFIDCDFADRWVHVAMAYDGTRRVGWIDGVRVVDKVTSLNTGADYHCLGYAPGQGFWLAGSVDEVRVYNRCLSDAEVTELFLESTPVQCKLRIRGLCPIGAARNRLAGSAPLWPTTEPRRLRGLLGASFGFRSPVTSIIGVETSIPSSVSVGFSSKAPGLCPLGVGARRGGVSILGCGLEVHGRVGLGLHSAWPVPVALEGASPRLRLPVLAPLSTGPVRLRSRSGADLAVSDPARGRLRGRVGLHDPITVVSRPTVVVLLDGAPITDQVTRLSISLAETSLHDQVDLEVACPGGLWDRFDPATAPGVARLIIIIGDVERRFLLEGRDGDEHRFRVSGRSASARFEPPYTPDVSVRPGEPVFASAAAALLVGEPVDWRACDWTLPDDYAFSGAPLEGITQLAAAVGAVVRAAPGGGLVVRPLWPIRPVRLGAAIPDLSLDADRLLSLTAAFERSGGYNAFVVQGGGAQSSLPTLEVETQSPAPGQDVLVRAWSEGRPPESWLLDAFVTAGLIRDLGVAEQVFTDRVQFADGKGRLQHPPVRVLNFRWIGTPAQDFTFTPHSSELTCGEPGYGLAKVEYAARFRRWQVAGHAVEALLFVLAAQGAEQLTALVSTNRTPHRQSPEAISEPLLTSLPAVVARATAEIDAQAYDRDHASLSIPYAAEAVDGAVIALDAPEMGAQGHFKVAAASIQVEGAKVVSSLEVVRCRLS